MKWNTFATANFEIQLSLTISILTLNSWISDDGMFNISTIMQGAVALNDVAGLQQLAADAAIYAFNIETVKKLLDDTNEKFDVVVAELYESELYAGWISFYYGPTELRAYICFYSVAKRWQNIHQEGIHQNKWGRCLPR